MKPLPDLIEPKPKPTYLFFVVCTRVIFADLLSKCLMMDIFLINLNHGVTFQKVISIQTEAEKRESVSLRIECFL